MKKFKNNTAKNIKDKKYVKCDLLRLHFFEKKKMISQSSVKLHYR